MRDRRSKSDPLDIELSKVLFKHEPDLLACGPEATGRAAFAIANLLGCILANVLATQGSRTYEQVLRRLIQKMHESATATADKARRMAATGDEATH